MFAYDMDAPAQAIPRLAGNHKRPRRATAGGRTCMYGSVE